MKTTLFYGLLVILSVSMLASCSKDIGNYEYHDINQITFTDFQSAAGYQVPFGETLTINPTLVMTKDQNPNDADYTYEWSLRLGSSSAPPLRDSVISTDKVLKVKIGLAPGTYSLQYKVTDKNTTVQFQKRTTLTVTTDVYEGYMVLNEVNGQSRLDMLSYNKTTNVFTPYTDVLKKQNSALTLQGVPYQVLCMNYSRASVVPQNYGIFLLSGSGTNRVNQETLSWDPTYNIKYLMVGEPPQNFTSQRLTGVYNNTNSSPVFCMYANNNMYTYSTAAGWAFKNTPINTYTLGEAPFKVSPYVATDGVIATMYDMDNKNFVTLSNYSNVTVSPAAATLEYPTGLDLLYMDCNYYPEGGQVKTTYAILKDASAGKYYILRFVLGVKKNYFEEILGTDFDKFSNCAFSPDQGYMFYSVGGKVYEYDLALQTSKLMIDKGTSLITYLSFPHFYDRYGKTNYVDWSKWLNVGYYDPAGTPGSNGVLEQYSVPPVNGQIVQTSRWTGFGRIVSVAYRGR